MPANIKKWNMSNSEKLIVYNEYEKEKTGYVTI